MLTVQADEHQGAEGRIDQRQQFVEAAATGADYLALGCQRALQPLQVFFVAGDAQKGLVEALVHRDNPLWPSKLPFSMKNSRPQLGS
ncbi:hypothetical protein D3C81_1175750 [compost metagenome]